MESGVEFFIKDHYNTLDSTSLTGWAAYGFSDGQWINSVISEGDMKLGNLWIFDCGVTLVNSFVRSWLPGSL